MQTTSSLHATSLVAFHQIASPSEYIVPHFEAYNEGRWLNCEAEDLEVPSLVSIYSYGVMI